jgi:hypothetical protein
VDTSVDISDDAGAVPAMANRAAERDQQCLEGKETAAVSELLGSSDVIRINSNEGAAGPPPIEILQYQEFANG